MELYYLINSDYTLVWIDSKFLLQDYHNRLKNEEKSCDFQMKIWRTMLNRYYAKGLLVDQMDY